jgi:hypothetical protein
MTVEHAPTDAPDSKILDNVPILCFLTAPARGASGAILWRPFWGSSGG